MKLPNKAIIKIEYNDENREYIFDIKELYDIIKEKQLIIDKAIEIIEKLKNDNSSYYDETIINNTIRDLLDILKGCDK